MTGRARTPRLSRDVRILLSGQTVASLGGAASWFALPLLVLRWTGSATVNGAQLDDSRASVRITLREVRMPGPGTVAPLVVGGRINDEQQVSRASPVGLWLRG